MIRALCARLFGRDRPTDGQRVQAAMLRPTLLLNPALRARVDAEKRRRRASALTTRA